MYGHSRNRINEPWVRFSPKGNKICTYLQLQDDSSIFGWMHIRFLGCDLKSSSWDIKDRQRPGKPPNTAVGSMSLGTPHFAGSIEDCGRCGRGEITCIVTFPSEIYPKEKMPSLWHKSPAFHQGLSQMEGQEQRGMGQRGRWGESSSQGGPNGCLTKLPMSCLPPAFPYVTNDIIFPGFNV